MGAGDFKFAAQHVTRAALEGVLHLPLREAASQLGVGISILKRRCRQEDIPRWPSRKLASMSKMIDDLSADGAACPRGFDAARLERERLLRERQQLLSRPGTELNARTFRMRQLMFKYAHRHRSSATGGDGE